MLEEMITRRAARRAGGEAGHELPGTGSGRSKGGCVDGAAKRSVVIARDDSEIGAGYGRATSGLTRRVTSVEKC